MNKTVHLTFALLIVLFILSATNVEAGWRTPRTGELGRESGWRNGDITRYLLVKADFDGDGKEDVAYLLMNDNDDEIGLFVRLASEKNTPLLIEIIKNRSMLEVIGIGLAKRGTYKTACGKGYWDCEEGEPKRVRLKNPGINLFKYESANSFFIWNTAKKVFDRIVMGD
jgi:hypothetical protein